MTPCGYHRRQFSGLRSMGHTREERVDMAQLIAAACRECKTPRGILTARRPDPV